MICVERRALADELVPRLERRPQLPVLAAQRAELEPFAHRVEHVVLRERLLDEAERAEPAGLERGRRVPCAETITTGSVSFMPRRRLSTSSPSRPGILMSRNTRSGISRSAMASAFRPGAGGEHFVAVVFENHPHRVADGGLVVDDEDAGFHGSRVGDDGDDERAGR